MQTIHDVLSHDPMGEIEQEQMVTVSRETISLEVIDWWEPMPSRIGTINHSPNGVTASIHQNYRSTHKVRRYHCGLEPPNYQLPAIRLAVTIMPNMVEVASYDYFYGERLAKRQCWRVLYWIMK